MSRRVEIPNGTSYGRLTVLREVEPLPSSGQRQRSFECLCACGKVGVYRLYSLRNGNTRSCGCLAHELAVESGHRLGMTYGGGTPIHGESGTVEYQTWQGLKSRCGNPNASSWADYGGRGITVCERWLGSFPAFLEDVGRRPSSDFSIHRVDNDGDYEPGNCVWATSKEQARNRRNTVRIEHNGETVLLVELAEELADGCDIPRKVIEYRLRYGKSADEAVKPHNPRFPVEFFGETVELNELSWRFGQSPDAVRRRMKRGMALEEALTTPCRRGDPFYRTPLVDRGRGWYQEYERREMELWCRGLASLYGVKVSEFKPRVEAALRDGDGRNAAIFRALKELGAVD